MHKPLLKHTEVAIGAHVNGSDWQVPDHAALQAEAGGSQVFLGPMRPQIQAGAAGQAACPVPAKNAQ